MKDINLNWRSKQDPVILYDDAAMRQAIYNVLFFSENECYHGSGDEVNLRSELFTILPISGDSLSIRTISDKLRKFDNRFKLIESASSVTSIGDQYQLHLVIEYDYGKSITIDQRVEVV
jgi:hypothetical protein